LGSSHKSGTPFSLQTPFCPFLGIGFRKLLTKSLLGVI
jgi:hypothetical protein